MSFMRNPAVDKVKYDDGFQSYRKSAKACYQEAQELMAGKIDAYHDGTYIEPSSRSRSELQQKALLKYDEAIDELGKVSPHKLTEKDKANMITYLEAKATAYDMLGLTVLARNERAKFQKPAEVHQQSQPSQSFSF